MRKRIAVAVLAVGCSALALALPAFSGAEKSGGAEKFDPRPRPVRVQSGSHFVRATQGSYCVSDGHVGQCGDYAYPLETKGYLLVFPGDRLVFRMHDGAIKSVDLQLLKVRKDKVHSVGSGFAAKLDKKHPKRWIARVPNRIGSANKIDISVIYKRHIGDADYWAGISGVRAVPVAPAE